VVLGCGQEQRVEQTGFAMQQRMRRMMTVAVAASAWLALPAPTANADAQGCTPAGTGYVCVHVHGSRTNVTTVDVSRGKVGKDGICAYSATIDVTAPSGDSVYHDDTGVIRNGECAYGRAYITLQVQREFPRRSHLCARFFEDGKQQGGAPCETIK
jgi:hypothetical protein